MIEPVAARKVSKAFDQKMSWVYDEHRTWNLRFTHENTVVHAFIQKRPHYCDRGHYQLNIDILKSTEPWGELDPQDGFPRYYMSFKTAAEECESFLIWRLLKIPMEQQWISFRR